MPVDLTWDAPGPGDWWLVRDHFPNSVCRMFSSLFPAVTIGWKHGAARYGLPTGEARWASVNGWIYYGPQVPLTEGELEAREQAAAATLRSTPWRDEVGRWRDEERPRVVEADLALQAVEPVGLDDEALAVHFRAAADNFLRWAPLHFEHAGFDVAGGLLFRAAEGLGLDPVAVADLLAGASPASAAVEAHLRLVAEALDRAGAAAPMASLDAIRAESTEAQAALDAFLEQYGWRLIGGLDLLEPTVGERPELVVASVNASRRRGPAAPREQAVPDFDTSAAGADRARFDELLADARASYALRDDDVGVCWNWPLGLLRRAGLELGRRLTDGQRLDDPRHLFEAEVDEALALLSGQGPPAAELARRWERRMAATVEDPPPHLDGGGGPDDGPLPPAVARLAAIRDGVWQLAPRRVDAPLHGIGIGSRPAVGPARVVRDADGLIRLVEGDVLVTVATTSAFNAVFPLLAAVVTEQGNLFSHTAILARELGLPAVLGVQDVFAGVRDGDLIEVDPRAGAVRIIAAAGPDGEG